MSLKTAFLNSRPGDLIFSVITDGTVKQEIRVLKRIVNGIKDTGEEYEEVKASIAKNYSIKYLPSLPREDEDIH